MQKINIIDVKYDLEEWTFSLNVNIWLLLLGVISFFLIRFLLKRFVASKKIHSTIIPVKMRYKIGGAEVEYSINRNFQNIEIAHRIYTELLTRKAALPLEENDVVIEVYNSWYTIFQTTREELKTLSGEMLSEIKYSKDLIQLLTDILNKGLRPHLTEHQARFRKWYNEAVNLKTNENKSPQEIQSQYDKFEELTNSMKNVNLLLIAYSEKLSEIVLGKKKNGT